MTLALSILRHEIRRYIGAIFALSLSGILILGQFSLLSGIGGAVTAVIDRTPADLIVLPVGARSFSDGGTLPERFRPLLFRNPEVVTVEDLEARPATLAKLAGSETRSREQVVATGINLAPSSLTVPTDFPAESRAAIAEPFTAIVDRSTLTRFDIKVGDKVTLNGQLVRIVGTVSTYPSVLRPVMFMSHDTLQLLGLGAASDRLGPLLIRLRDPASAKRVCAELNAASGGQYRVWTRQDLSEANRRQFMTTQAVGLTLGFSSLLGLAIGLGVTSQSMRSALMSEIRPFAALRALGVSHATLRATVFELAFWMLGAACIVMVACTALLAWAADAYSVPFDLAPGAGLAVLMILAAVALLSGLGSLRVLRLVEPMDLLR